MVAETGNTAAAAAEDVEMQRDNTEHADAEDAALLIASPYAGNRPQPHHDTAAGHKDTFWPAGLASLTIQTPDTSARSGGIKHHKPANIRQIPTSRWRTPEFMCYYAIVLMSLTLMANAPIRLSQESHPNFWIYTKRLSPGWIGERKIDITDNQYRQFREGLPSLIGLATSYLTASKVYTYIVDRRSRQTLAPPATPNLRAPYQRVPFLLASSVFIILALHGLSALKIALILYLNLKIHDIAANHRYTPYAVWLLNIAVLFSNEIFGGYRFSSISASLSFMDEGIYAGLIPRWHVSFNIAILRLISFSMDYHWARNGYPKQTTGDLAANLHDYSWQNYVAYVLYPPLYIAGPIISFDAFIEQVKRQNRVSRKSSLSYLIRFGICWLTMEVILHYMYVGAMKDSWAFQNSGNQTGRKVMAWEGDSPLELAMISFWNLVIMWLKLLLPWRFFRLWSLLDNIDPPENMIRCVLNNYSTRGFWRSWHRSYNIWLLKYLYLPVIKSSNTLVATLLVFTFVALWHDLSFHLLAWGWLISLFVLPEILAAKALPEEKFGQRSWYRHVCAIGAIFNILMMITANTVGFVLGVESTLTFLKAVVGSWEGLAFLSLTFVALFSASHIMFEYREEEFRHGIQRKC